MPAARKSGWSVGRLLDLILKCVCILVSQYVLDILDVAVWPLYLGYHFQHPKCEMRDWPVM